MNRINGHHGADGFGLNGNSAPLGFNLPPQNMESESGVLGSVLLDNAVIADVFTVLKAEDFFRDANQTVYGSVRKIHERGLPVDAVTLADELDRTGKLSGVGGIDYIAQLVGSVPHAANAVYYANIVREKAIARRLVEACEQTLRECYSNTHTASELVQAAESRVRAAEDDSLVAGEPVRLYDSATDVLDQIRRGMSGEVCGVNTGYEELDVMIDGLYPESLYVVGARPNVGKTMFSLAVAGNVAAFSGSVLFFSLEMSHKQLTRRYLSSKSGVPLKTIKTSENMSPSQENRIVDSIGKDVGSLPLWIVDNSAPTVHQIGAMCRRHKAKHGLDLVIVDYLQIVEPEKTKNGSREAEVAGIAKGLKALAKTLQVPVIALAQLNRELEKRADRTPILADMRESGVIEAAADVVMLLHRPEMYDQNDRPGIFQVIVAKGRDCDTGTVNLFIDRIHQRIIDPRKEPPPAVPFPADCSFKIDPPFARDSDTAF